MDEKTKLMLLWVAIMMPVGIALAITLKNPGLLGVGPAIGAALGQAAYEQKNRRK